MSDPRLTPARPDLAAAHLKGTVQAERFAEASPRAAIVPAAPIRKAPDEDAPMDDQLLFGDRFDVYEEKDGWAWGQAQGDSYVGYVRSRQLAEPGPPPDLKITALRSYAFSQPDIKSRPEMLLSLNARLTVSERQGRFVRDARAGWIIAGDTAPLDAAEPDYAGAAERFLGAPYLWGGKESLGLDCSGLVQMALAAACIAAPRDSDLQETLGEPVEIAGDLTGLKRGDLVFWAGHVGVMLDPARLIHANAHHMRTEIEPLTTAAARIAERGTPVRSIRRLIQI